MQLGIKQIMAESTRKKTKTLCFFKVFFAPDVGVSAQLLSVLIAHRRRHHLLTTQQCTLDSTFSDSFRFLAFQSILDSNRFFY